MEEKRIFLASSIDEFARERLLIGNLIYLLNDEFIMHHDQKLYLRLCKCEDMDAAISQSRKQNDYNQYIVDCDFFLMLAGERSGAYTMEEFRIALEHSHPEDSAKIWIIQDKRKDCSAFLDNARLTCQSFPELPVRLASFEDEADLIETIWSVLHQDSDIQQLSALSAEHLIQEIRPGVSLTGS